MSQVCQHSGIVIGKEWLWVPWREWNCREWMYIGVRGRREHSMHSWNAWCLFVCEELEKLCMCTWVAAIYLCWSTATQCCLFPGCGAFPASVGFFSSSSLSRLTSPLYPLFCFTPVLFSLENSWWVYTHNPQSPRWHFKPDYLFCCCTYCCFCRLKTPLAPQMILSTCTDPMMMNWLLIVISVNLPLDDIKGLFKFPHVLCLKYTVFGSIR